MPKPSCRRWQAENGRWDVASGMYPGEENALDIRKLFSFEGRVGRGVIWGLAGANLLIFMVVGSIASNADNAFLTFLAVVVFLVISVIGIATNVKRWHDRDKSGAWYFIAFVPIVGAIWTLVELGFLPGTDGANQYGAPDSGSPFVGDSLPADTTALPQRRSEWGR